MAIELKFDQEGRAKKRFPNGYTALVQKVPFEDKYDIFLLRNGRHVAPPEIPTREKKAGIACNPVKRDYVLSKIACLRKA